MSDDPHSITGALKKASPFWWWIRGNPSLVITLIVLTGGIIGSWYDVKSRVSNVEKSVASLADKVDKIPQHAEISYEDWADLRHGFATLQKDDTWMMWRWCLVDEGRKGGRRANCKP